VFDMLELNGQSLLDEPLHERKERIAKLFSDSEVFFATPFMVTDNPEELRVFHRQTLGDGLEGIVVKQWASGYHSGRKGWTWVKMKEAEGSRGKLTDTVDCVVMGYYLGEGKRTEFGVGAFLAGVMGKDGRIKTVTKVGTGLTDDQLRELVARGQKLQAPGPVANYDVPKALIPDVWLNPELVVEVAADEITQSPTHTAGVALRFPRLVRWRDDKKTEQITTVEELASIEIGK
jgi:DNA ligase-1